MEYSVIINMPIKYNFKQGKMRMKYMVDLNILKSEMERRGIRSVEELSERSRINKRELLLVLNGKQLHAMDIMVELASALELSPEKAKEIFFA